MYIWGFSILVILFEWFHHSIQLDLYTVFVLSTVLLDACDWSILLNVSIFFSEIGEVVAYSTTVCFDFPSLWTMSVFPSLTTVSVVVINNSLISSKYPLVFLNFSLGVSYYLGNGKIVLGDLIPVLDILHPVNSRISDLSSPHCELYNQFHILIVLPNI